MQYIIFPDKSPRPGFKSYIPTLCFVCPSTSPETGQPRCEVIAVPLTSPVNKLLTASRPLVEPPSWERSLTGAGHFRLMADILWIIEIWSEKIKRCVLINIHGQQCLRSEFLSQLQWHSNSWPKIYQYHMYLEIAIQWKVLNFADHDINVIREKSFLTNIQLNFVVRTAFIAVFCCQVYLMMLPCCLSEFIYLYSYSYILFRFHLDHHTDWHWRSKPKGEGIFIFLSINAKMKKINYYILLKIIRLSLGPPPKLLW